MGSENEHEHEHESNKRPRDDAIVDEPKKKFKFYSPQIPTSAHYHNSWMHAEIVTHVATSLKHGFVLTASADGIVKFWKRLTVAQDKPAEGTTKEASSSPCLEFVKSFTAHAGAIQSFTAHPNGDVAVSVGSDGLLKFYEISTFDVLTMIATRQAFGAAACWLQTDVLAVAVSNVENGHILVYSTTELVQIVKLHADVVTTLTAVPHQHCVVSTDAKGVVEVWSTAAAATCTSTVSVDEMSETPLTLNVGGTCTIATNHIAWTSKFDTDLYDLVRKKTYCISAAATSTHYALLCADMKIRIFYHATGKIAVTIDETANVYDKLFTNFGLDSIEYGKRAALDRELAHSSNVFEAKPKADSAMQKIILQFDPSGKYLLIPTMIGIKVLDFQKRKLVATIGTDDASQLRFLTICLASGDAKVNKQLDLARRASTKTSAAAEASMETISDSLLIALAYNQRRLYVFSQLDPVEDPDASDDVIAKRDIWNEAPSVQDTFYTDNRSGGISSSVFTKAILRTTLGDIHIQLFSSQVPKTIENFVGHSKSGYYDNVIFHRVIKGFMLQTGDPLGDGTGGESIWGGEFEDEFVPGLRHDRAFTVSMANAGPNTNGSQFFITVVPTLWLDNKHTVFGRVTQGMDVCTLIENVKTDDLDKPLEDIRILNVDLE
jgi:peptidylprolyl isomerase domain and WD repeat-containing protein 1